MILVDPDTKQVIAQATTDISHPLKHATMLCLDQLASVRGGGAWDKKDSPLSREGGLQKDLPEGVATERGDCPPAKRPKLQYLCTGYDAYCSAEPCIM
jgi:tRNA(Arg) A34 adenosine deaminase TadA